MPQGLCPLPGDFRLATRPGLSQLSQDLPSLVVSSELNRTLTPQTLSAWYFGFSPPSKGGGCQRDGQRNVLTLCVASCQRYFSRACRVTSSSGKWFALGNSHIKCRLANKLRSRRHTRLSFFLRICTSGQVLGRPRFWGQLSSANVCLSRRGVGPAHTPHSFRSRPVIMNSTGHPVHGAAPFCFSDSVVKK